MLSRSSIIHLSSHVLTRKNIQEETILTVTSSKLASNSLMRFCCTSLYQTDTRHSDVFNIGLQPKSLYLYFSRKYFTNSLAFNIHLSLMMLNVCLFVFMVINLYDLKL